MWGDKKAHKECTVVGIYGDIEALCLCNLAFYAL
ncbi:hypothetical protein GYH30_047097 [Glycine max]|nr:hypothetical protein GYH30_047097 [Glycine max]